MNIDELVKVIGQAFVDLFPKKDDPDPWETWNDSKTFDEIINAIAEAINKRWCIQEHPFTEEGEWSTRCYVCGQTKQEVGE